MSSKNKGIIELLKSKGLLFPTTPDEIVEFEKNYSTQDEVPQDWENPTNIILRGKQSLKDLKQAFNEDAENLAMAAREGKDAITDEIRKQMNDDRTKAKDKK
ncbi:hypothetical protein [Parasediminibacterium sp. JCM 36343]|uniref:hypothetical protein n=1 Tax=Parasediminibacterium sp. JCM 36343 TaxID=3374279 RepID=UPI00397CF474